MDHKNPAKMLEEGSQQYLTNKFIFQLLLIATTAVKQTESKALFRRIFLFLFGALTISPCEHILCCSCRFISMPAQNCANILGKTF